MELGLEVFIKNARKYRGQRIGLVCNQASVDRTLRHASELVLSNKNLEVTCFFGPQHGIRGEKQDNMVESDDFIEPASGLPVYSLYGTSREPTETSLAALDTFVVDMQDIGTRIYTFMYTMANCMRAAKRTGKKVVVLDRPNPIGGVQIEGNVLDPKYASFVGQFPICTRHGMTMGELALMFNDAFGIHCELSVVPMKKYSRKSYWQDLNRDWVVPSPNIPTPLSALAFPATVTFEGTNISEGRGTTHPFEWVGAPYVNPDALAAEMMRMKLPGVVFRPIFFQPTYQKGKDTVCGGVQIHVTDRKKFRPFVAGVRLLAKIAELYPKDFVWKKPPYEYEYEKMPIDLIAGTSKLREAVDARKGTKAFEEMAEEELLKFSKLRKRYLLYKV